MNKAKLTSTQIMKALITISIIFICHTVLFSQAKFKQGVEHKVKISKPEKKKKYKKVKENLGSGNKRKVKMAYGIGLYNLKMNEKTNLNIDEQGLYLRETRVGHYQYNYENGYYNNTIELANRTTTWVTNERPETYEYTNSTNANRQAVGMNFEVRMIKDDGLGSPTGFFFNGGTYILNKSLTGLNHNELEVLFPLGLGFIIPGNQDFWIEIGASSILGHSKSLGGKFDFSLVWNNLKITPSFMYLENKRDILFKSGGLGLGLTYIPKKLSRHRHKKRR